MTATDDRYQEIMRRLAENKRQKTLEPVQKTLAGLLDHLNAWDVLERVRFQTPKGISAYGPQTRRREDCVSVIIWFKAGGYYGYKHLTLLGVWASAENRVDVGTKRLAYRQLTYNPESYHKLIRKDLNPYYKDDGLPPAQPLLTFTFSEEERLVQRQQLAELLTGYSF
jgi:hypothetical protein